MTESDKFSFGDNSVARAYDNILVPLLFEPWAVRIVNEHPHWEGLRVLDLATGTGIVAQLLAQRVGSSGKVVGVDINGEMLSVAKKRCASMTSIVDFVESPVCPLEVSDNSIDIVICQQGFQFFPDKRNAAEEIYRVLRDGGKSFVSTWCSLTECEFFWAVFSALNEIKEPEIAELMRVPFDFMSESELASSFVSVGFEHVENKKQKQALRLNGGLEQAIELAYATPISPKLRALTEEKQFMFRDILGEHLNLLSDDGVIMGDMVSNVLSAKKPI